MIHNVNSWIAPEKVCQLLFLYPDRSDWEKLQDPTPFVKKQKLIGGIGGWYGFNDWL